MFNKIAESIYALARLHTVSGVIVSLLIPLLIALYAAYYDKLVAISLLLFWGPAAILILITLSLTIASVGVKIAPELAVEVEALSKTKDRLSKDIFYLSLLHEEILAWNAMVRAYIEQRLADKPALIEAIGKMCAGLAENGREYFEFERKEKWNFAVYLWNAETSRLEPAWREKAKNHPSTGVGRSWRDGEGHVGHAFRNRSPIITADAQAPGVADLMVANQNVLPYDANTYRSYVSWPILPRNETERPYGVIVATSDKMGRFDYANALVINHAAVALATVIETAYDSP